MRKKITVCAITALLMGFAIMMLPLALETGPPTYQPKIPEEYILVPNSSNEAQGSTRNLYGLTSQSQNMLPSTLILLTGLVAALIAYIFFKKQMIPQ